MWPAVCPAGTGAPADMFPCCVHPLPGLIPVTREALHPRVMKGEEQRVKKGQRWGTCGWYTHASTPSPALNPSPWPWLHPTPDFNKSLNSLVGEHPSALHSRVRSWGPVSRCASWKQDRAIPAQRGRLCLRSGSPGSPSVKDEVPAPWHQSFAKKKQMLGDGMGCAFGSVC